MNKYLQSYLAMVRYTYKQKGNIIMKSEYLDEVSKEIFDIIYYRLRYAHLLEDFTKSLLNTSGLTLAWYLGNHELKPLLEQLFAQRPVEFFYLYEHLYNKKGDK